MLTFFIYLVTAVLVLDCVFLVMLVLVQLPKKEAGMGQAFGGAATDALFGAGSGNVLTKATKWGAALFFALAIALTIMGTYKTTSNTGRLQRIMSERGATTTTTPAPTPTPNVPAANTPNTPAPVVPNQPAPGANTPATPTPVPAK
jgi:preprotein translocase subunit SecG